VYVQHWRRNFSFLLKEGIDNITLLRLFVIIYKLQTITALTGFNYMLIYDSGHNARNKCPSEAEITPEW